MKVFLAFMPSPWFVPSEDFQTLSTTLVISLQVLQVTHEAPIISNA